MRFTPDGPDIPEQLLRQHEDGEVVFFCGAGVSVSAGLPNFKGLVQAVFEGLHEAWEPSETAAFGQNQFDRVLAHLESRLQDGRGQVRSAVADVLTTVSGTSPTHVALLDLACSRTDHGVRLITTNFDRLFEAAATEANRRVGAYVAPLLPVPKPDRWSGIVYLHGRLPVGDEDEAAALQNLVLSSGDFGLAYLTERWAARFLSEVFRRFNVCFVGYSLGDPVLRYIVDTLSADRQRGEAPREAYAFVEAGEAGSGAWDLSGARIIPYASTDGNHDALHQTLRAWAGTFRQRAFGKRAIVARDAQSRPPEGADADGLVGRMLWALSDPSGIPAKQFADMRPAPPWEWLTILTEPYSGRPLLDLVALCSGRTLTRVESHLLRWLRHHLDKPEMFLLVSRCPVPIAGSLSDAIHSALGQCPEPIRAAWRLLLSGCVGQLPRINVFAVRAELAEGREAIAERIWVREALAPCLRVGPQPDYVKERLPGEPETVAQLFRCELVFRTRDPHSFLEGALGGRLPALLPELNGLVREALDILSAIGEANLRDDGTHWSMPSIAPHGQNQSFPEWVWLIGLLRDAWLATLAEAPARARAYAMLWWTEPYPLFKRLALFAATKEGIDPEHHWLSELLADDAYWLWAVEVRREVLRAIAEVAPRLGVGRLDRLQGAILAGPPTRIFRNPDLTEERRAEIAEYAIWVRLEKLASAGVALSVDALSRLGQIRQRHPDWRLTGDHREEFLSWIGPFSFQQGLPAEGFGEELPANSIELAKWLVENPGDEAHFSGRDGRWAALCRSDIDKAVEALEIAGKSGIWPAGRWQEALDAWSDKEIAAISLGASWRVIEGMPRETMTRVAAALAWWLRSVATELSPTGPAPEFAALCEAVLGTVEGPLSARDDAVMAALNSCAGLIAEAVLRVWLNRKPERGEPLPGDLLPVFALMCKGAGLRDARTMLAANALALFRADPAWFRDSLGPLFDWDSSMGEAAAAWSGLVYTWRADALLIAELSGAFIATASHYEALGRWSGRYATALAWVSVEPGAPLTIADRRAAFRALPPEGRVEASGVLIEIADAAGAAAAEAWRGRIKPFIQDVWPHPAAPSAALAEQFARLAIRTGDAFEDAVTTVRPWLCPLGNESDLFVRELGKSGLCARFPETALQLLSVTVADRIPWPNELNRCLEEIAGAGEYANDQRFIRLRELGD